jgi:hypothetical protein
MHATRWTAIIVSALTIAVSACARNAAFQSEHANAYSSPTPNTVSVTVQNANYWDMKIYAVLDGSARLRLGTATGLTSTRFTATRSMFPTGRLRLVALQLGGRGIADPGDVQVFGGESVTFTIQPSLGTSYAFVR